MLAHPSYNGRGISLPFMGEAQERIHMWSLILLTKHSPHLPAIELEKKKLVENYHKLYCHQKNTSYMRSQNRVGTTSC